MCVIELNVNAPGVSNLKKMYTYTHTYLYNFICKYICGVWTNKSFRSIIKSLPWHLLTLKNNNNNFNIM